MPANPNHYTASDIEVLEGLEPVRKRPGMYIGGTDSRACHHLAAEIIDNAMDEITAGFGDRIDAEMVDDGRLIISDNGRGIPIDAHPKFPDKSALEIIMTTLHAGGKFSEGTYTTSGGLHGVGASVVNALSARLTVESARDGKLYRQEFARGVATSKLTEIDSTTDRQGTRIAFTPDPEIFGDGIAFQPASIYTMLRSKAYLFPGVSIHWRCHPSLLKADSEIPTDRTLSFANGLTDYLSDMSYGTTPLIATPFTDAVATATNGKAETPQEASAQAKDRVEFAMTWYTDSEDSFVRSYCNTIPTPDGGSHEAGLRQALVRGIRNYGEIAGIKRVADIIVDDVMANIGAVLSIFIPSPQFQGQTKNKLASPDATRLVESAVRGRFETWLASDRDRANTLLEGVLAQMEDRKRRRQEREVARKSATRRLRLPGKLADCTVSGGDTETEIFIVEGDSAGGSAKQARDRKTQAVLPLRGKILNVASASLDKTQQNQELADLALALGVKGNDIDTLRYDRVIIMTDADVDGAHIAALLMTYFYQQMPRLIEEKKLYIAQPPLYRLAQGGDVRYALDDEERDDLLKNGFKGKGKIEVSRFKGLGEMPPAQLKATTMAPTSNRRLLRVVLPSQREKKARREVDSLVTTLMGRKAEGRYDYIRNHAPSVMNTLDI
ncbi:MAG: type IIA DNA topoisomerase subunit B [Proteobacteria bacterium]|nr:type IIA DNA topoisomerase subunit B [Pseudomonadota bacterium]